jgi:hypothetical protein
MKLNPLSIDLAVEIKNTYCAGIGLSGLPSDQSDVRDRDGRTELLVPTTAHDKTFLG